jgi:hypothetical protein
MSGIPAFLLGAYLLIVVTSGQGEKLSSLLREERAFVPWFIALAVIVSLRGKLGKVGNGLIVVTFAGMALETARRGELTAAINQFTKFFEGK